MHGYPHRHSLVIAFCLFAIALALLILLIGVVRAHAEPACPEPNFTARVQCRDGKAILHWQYTNLRDVELLVQARTSYGNGPEVILPAGATKDGNIPTNLVTVPSGQVEFYSTIYSHQSGFWLEYADYAAGACSPTAVTLSSFTAVSAGNRGGCAPENRWYFLPCSVTDAGPGWVSGTCHFGQWFHQVHTLRTFLPGQNITVRACEGPAGELFSAPGFALRISR